MKDLSEVGNLSVIRPPDPTFVTAGRLDCEMSKTNRKDLYQSVASLRSYTFELLDRMQGTPADPTDLSSAVAVRLQAVANQLGAVEALVAPLPEGAGT